MVKSFSARAICDIIEACGNHNVLEFSCEEFTLKFAGKQTIGSKAEGPPQYYTPDISPALDTVNTAEMGSHEDYRHELSFEEQQILEHVDDHNELANNPVAWETRQIDACIEQDRWISGEQI